MEIQSRKYNAALKIGTGVLVLLIFVGITMYVKQSQDARGEGLNHDYSAVTGTDSLNNTPADLSSNSNSSTTSRPTSTPRNSNQGSTSTGSTGSPTATAYKNGTYTATGNYSSPGGQEGLTVTLTLSGDKITAVSAQGMASSPTSREYMIEFLDNYKPLVIGKDISDLRLGKVAGASLTGRGFNDALSQIKAQAAA